MWVFSVEFGTIIIYAHVFLHLRKRLQTIREVGVHRSAGNKERLSQAARYMILYPIIYIVLTLPIASGRMAAMAGNKLPIAFYGVAGSFLTSCGWLDTLLYTLTRRVFIKAERPMTGVSTHVQSRASAAISAHQQQQRRWLGVVAGKREKVPPLPTRNDPSWPLSTFASMTVDFKDLSEAASDDGTAFALAPPGSLDGSRVGTPSADEAMRNQQISMRETTIVAGLITEEMLLAQRGILSETRIEITTATVDELLERRDSMA
jgi:G protein-coupled glucose receptor regulating Gpa2 C-term